ncbi:Hypothetical predicted protein [Octopus vulgaris]|uniref:Uncharacterized protein n=1 Tax=Octopus vulgaris TaxID=6645 RepID=A0AA36BVY0_OCTVU|nr:Hypothetical predicted protein [Octopus vulgaris]
MQRASREISGSKPMNLYARGEQIACDSNGGGVGGGAVGGVDRFCSRFLLSQHHPPPQPPPPPSPPPPIFWSLPTDLHTQKKKGLRGRNHPI